MDEFQENSASENGINPDLYGRQLHIEDVAEWAFRIAHREERNDNLEAVIDAEKVKSKTRDYLKDIYNYGEDRRFRLRGENSLTDEEAYKNILMERKRVARDRPSLEPYYRADELADYVEEVISEEVKNDIELADDIWGVEIEER